MKLTKAEIVKKTEDFNDEITVLLNNAKKTKRWIDDAVWCDFDNPKCVLVAEMIKMEKKFSQEIKAAENKMSEFRKFQEENPFDDAPMAT